MDCYLEGGCFEPCGGWDRGVKSGNGKLGRAIGWTGDRGDEGVFDFTDLLI